MYAFGICIYSIVTEKEPFDNFTSYEQFLEAVTRKKSPERPQLPKEESLCPETLHLLADVCWQRRASKRPTFEQILSVMHEDVLVDCFVQSEEGRKFWKAHFVEDNKLKMIAQWTSFIGHFSRDFYVSTIQKDQIEYKTLRYLFANANKDQVKLEDFGRTLGLLGKFEKVVWLSKVVKLFKQQWFWGFLGTNEANTLLHQKPAGTFLIRFSSSGANYTVSVIKDKIYHLREPIYSIFYY